MPIERFNGSKLGLTHDESRPESGTHETLPDSAIRPEVETPFDRANKAATGKKIPGLIPLEEAVDPTILDTSLVDDTKALAAKLNARYEASHPQVHVTNAHEEQDHVWPVTTEDPSPIGSTVEETVKEITKEPTEAGDVVHTLITPEAAITTRDPEETERFIAASMGPKVPEGYENAKDLSATTTPIAVKAEDMMQEIPDYHINQEEIVQDSEPITHVPIAKRDDDPEPALDSIRPTDAPSTIVLIAALMEILASQVKDDDDLPTMEELHFTRENLQVILGNPQIGKSFFEVFKDMLLASDYADLAFDFMFDGPEFEGMDKQSLIAGAKFAYSHMA